MEKLEQKVERMYDYIQDQEEDRNIQFERLMKHLDEKCSKEVPLLMEERL